MRTVCRSPTFFWRFCRQFSNSARYMARDYAAAVTSLNSLQTNFSIIDAIRKSGRRTNVQAIPEMIEWCRRIGYEPEEFNGLNVIHIAGTKGKGSTSAFTSSILCQYLGQLSRPGSVLEKIGLYTSPHLRSVRERIQINNAPLSEESFARYFFEVWDRLESSAQEKGPTADGSLRPVYFRYLTLMAYHVYLSEKVDTAIIECGIGGEYDSTNIITKPIVTGVTSLGIDHTAILGDTIENISWHKAGIFKPSVPAFTVPQPEKAMEVLRKRAEKKGAPLQIVPRHSDLEQGKVKLGLAADFQKTNASLAIAISAQALESLGISGNAFSLLKSSHSTALPSQFRTGLEIVQWGGRCETRNEGSITWFIDGGHTIESIKLAAEWYASQLFSANSATKPGIRILVFNQQTRNASALVQTLHTAISLTLPDNDTRKGGPLFSHAIFSTNVTFCAERGGYKPDLISINANSVDVEALSVQNSLAANWAELDRGSKTSVQPTIEDAVEQVREIAGEVDDNVQVFVTGSLHLVGGVLEVLETGKA